MKSSASTSIRTPTGRIASLVIAGSMALTGVLIAPAAAQASPGHRPPTRSCSLADATVTPHATVDTARTAAFTRYGNSGGTPSERGSGWSGGDSTYSAQLTGGRRAWIFSDTFLGPVAADGSRPQSTPFVNNSIVVESRGRLQTIHGGTALQPTSLVEPDADNSFFWFGSATAVAGGRFLDVIALRFEKFGTGAFDFRWTGNKVVRFDTRTWKRSAVKDLPSAAGVQWSAWTQPQGRDLLVYGVEDLGSEKYLHVAKVLGGNLADTARWRYWNGTAWSTRETDSARILDDVANEMSVVPFRDGYLAITQDTSVPFSAEIHGYVSCSATGGFREIGVLYSMPEVGAAGSYGDPNVFAYNAHEHPELRRTSRGGVSLEVTYNVNTFANADLYTDASIYRPRFVRVDLRVSRH